MDVTRIIVVDDEPELRLMVADYLGRYRFSVVTAEDGRDLDAKMAEGTPDLVLLDVNIPGENGLSIARRLRAMGTIPIIMLTAADDVVDRVVGLEIGADDYVSKPFDLRELRARVEAVLRRSRQQPAAAPVTEAVQSRVQFGSLSLDMDGHRLLRPDGSEIPLTTMEYDLLVAFANNPNRVLSRDRLLDLAHNRDGEPYDRSIDIRITRLRRKIELDPAKPQLIKTVRSAGYIFKPMQP